MNAELLPDVRSERACPSDSKRTRQLSVLQVVAGLAPSLGGPSKAVLEMAQALAEKGVRSVVFSTNLADRGCLSPFRSPNTLDIPTDRPQEIRGVEVRYFSVRWPSRFAFSPQMARGIRKRIHEFDVIEIHSLYLFPTLIAAFLARGAKVPYVIRPHGTLDPFMRKRHPIRKFLYTKILEQRNLDGAAAIHYTAQDEMELARPLGLKPHAMVVPLGVNNAEFSKLPERGSLRLEHPELAGRRLVVFMGRLVPKKGLNLLVESFAELLRGDPHVHLVIAGGDEDGYGEVVRKDVRRRGLEGHTLFVGMVTGDKKLSVLADADVWVLPSYSENFGIAVVEAMACGIPVIITNKVNIYREIGQAGAGEVVECDTDQLTAALKRVLASPARRRKMGDRGRALVASNFTWGAAADQLLAAYELIAPERYRQPVSKGS